MLEGHYLQFAVVQQDGTGKHLLLDKERIELANHPTPPLLR